MSFLTEPPRRVISLLVLESIRKSSIKKICHSLRKILKHLCVHSKSFFNHLGMFFYPSFATELGSTCQRRYPVTFSKLFSLTSDSCSVFQLPSMTTHQHTENVEVIYDVKKKKIFLLARGIKLQEIYLHISSGLWAEIVGIFGHLRLYFLQWRNNLLMREQSIKKGVFTSTVEARGSSVHLTARHSPSDPIVQLRAHKWAWKWWSAASCLAAAD